MPFCRCVDCGARRTLARRIESYLRIPPCRRCGGRRWREDKYRAKHERGRKAACRDPACLYHYPHRPGSLGCIRHPRFHEHEEELWQSHTTCLA